MTTVLAGLIRRFKVSGNVIERDYMHNSHEYIPKRFASDTPDRRASASRSSA